MKAAMTCREAGALIAGYRSGWLPADVARMVQEHVEACPACALEVRRDAALCGALAALPPEEAPVVAWTAPTVRTPRRPARLAVAAAVAVSGVALILVAHPGGVRAPVAVTTRPGPAGLSPAPAGPALWTEAHDLVSLSDSSADPNRLVVLLHSGRARRVGR